MKTLAFRRFQTGEKTYLVVLHTAAAPDEAEWRAYVEAVRATLAGSATDVDVFIVTDGGGPDAGQRKELAAAVARGARGAGTHVFTTDAFVRVIVSGFRWVSGARAFAYPPGEFGSVCARCGVSAAAVLKGFADVQASLPEVRMLGQIVTLTGSTG